MRSALAWSRASGERGWWHELTPAGLRADALAGLLGAFLVLPQGVAFAQLAGMPPIYGIYSAIVPCIVAALFGSSRHVVTGPTNANSLALYAMLSPLAAAGSPHYIQLVFTTTLMVGIFQILIARFRLGELSNFISPSVLIGFTAGAACLIAYHAMLHLQKLVGLGQGMNVVEIAIACSVIAVTAWTVRYRRHWPAMLLGLLSAYAVAAAGHALTARDVVRMGPIPSVIPPLSMPDFSFSTLSQLSGIALALTLVAVAQSISIAKAVAECSGQAIDANREFFGQGLANVAGSFASSYLACGSLNRSMPNFEAGARTPLAAVFSSLLLLVIAAVSMDFLALLPLAAIDALLLYVAWTLINVPRIREIVRFSRGETVCLLVTWAATVLIPIEFAILLGVGFSLGLHLHQTARPVMRTLIPYGSERRFTPMDELQERPPECPQLKLVRMEGEVYFGAAQHIENQLAFYRRAHPEQKHLLIMARSMNACDLAGMRLWWQEWRIRSQSGGGLYWHRPRARVLHAMRKAALPRLMDGENAFGTKHEAISAIVPRLNPEICRTCKARVFRECGNQRAPSDEPEEL